MSSHFTSQSPPPETIDYPQTQFIPEDNEILYEAQEILDERGQRGEGEYLVKWAGIDDDTGLPWDSSWECKSGCTDELIQEWKAKKARNPSVVGVEGKKWELQKQRKRKEEKEKQAKERAAVKSKKKRKRASEVKVKQEPGVTPIKKPRTLKSGVIAHSVSVERSPTSELTPPLAGPSRRKSASLSARNQSVDNDEDVSRRNIAVRFRERTSHIGLESEEQPEDDGDDIPRVISPQKSSDATPSDRSQQHLETRNPKSIISLSDPISRAAPIQSQHFLTQSTNISSPESAEAATKLANVAAPNERLSSSPSPEYGAYLAPSPQTNLSDNINAFDSSGETGEQPELASRVKDGSRGNVMSRVGIVAESQEQIEIFSSPGVQWERSKRGKEGIGGGDKCDSDDDRSSASPVSIPSLTKSAPQRSLPRASFAGDIPKMKSRLAGPTPEGDVQNENEVKTEISLLKSQLAGAQSALQTATSRVEALQTRYDESVSTRGKLQRDTAGYEKKVDTLSRQVDRFEGEKKNLEEKLKSKMNLLEVYEKGVKARGEEVEVMKRELGEVKEELEQEKEKKQEAEKMRKEAEAKLENHPDTEKLRQVREQHQFAQNRILELQRSLDEAGKTRSADQEKIDDLAAQLANSEEERQALSETMADIRRAYDQASTRTMEELSVSEILRTENKLLKEQVKHGLPQRQIHTQSSQAANSSQLRQLRAQIKILLDQSRLTDDGVRQRARMYAKYKEEYDGIVRTASEQSDTIQRLEGRVEQLGELVDRLRAVKMGLLDEDEEEQEDEETNPAARIPFPPRSQPKQITQPPTPLPGQPQSEDAVQVQVEQKKNGGSGFVCKWSEGENSCCVVCDSAEDLLGHVLDHQREELQVNGMLG